MISLENELIAEALESTNNIILSVFFFLAMGCCQRDLPTYLERELDCLSVLKKLNMDNSTILHYRVLPTYLERDGVLRSGLKKPNMNISTILQSNLSCLE